MASTQPHVRKVFSQAEVVHSSVGRSDDRGSLRRVALCALIENHYAGQGYAEHLTALITSVTKPATAGTVIDVLLAYKDEIWVRSHYDAMEVRVPDAPHPDEIVVIAAVANRGRLNTTAVSRSQEQAAPCPSTRCTIQL